MDEKILRIIVIAAALAILLLFAWLKDRKKNRQPIYTIKATIQSKSVVSTPVRGLYGPKNLLDYMVTFYLADGRIVELSAPDNVGNHPVGTTGTLVFQGTKCERFDPNK